MSTRAYSDVEEMARWRRTSAISGKGTPAFAIWQASVWRSRCARTIGTPARTHAQRTMPEIPSSRVARWAQQLARTPHGARRLVGDPCRR